jgi:hypothetical protein
MNNHCIIDERRDVLGVDANELLAKDYTEWRRTQSWYNDPDMDKTLEHFKAVNEEQEAVKNLLL